MVTTVIATVTEIILTIPLGSHKVMSAKVTEIIMIHEKYILENKQTIHFYIASYFSQNIRYEGSC